LKTQEKAWKTAPWSVPALPAGWSTVLCLGGVCSLTPNLLLPLHNQLLEMSICEENKPCFPFILMTPRRCCCCYPPKSCVRVAPLWLAVVQQRPQPGTPFLRATAPKPGAGLCWQRVQARGAALLGAGSRLPLGGRRGEPLPAAQQRGLERVKTEGMKLTFVGAASEEPCSVAPGYSTSGWRSGAVDLLLVSPFPKEGGGFLALQKALGSRDAPGPGSRVTLCACAHPQVAIKSIRKDKIKDEQDLVHIRREIEIMSSLNHPHIIAVHEGEPPSPLPFPAGLGAGAGSAAAWSALAALFPLLVRSRSCLPLPVPCW